MISECEVKGKCGINGCEEFHNPVLHVETKEAYANTIKENCDRYSEILLPIMKVTPDSKRCRYLSCLWDSAADVSLITNSMARKLCLNGKPAKLSVTFNDECRRSF